MRLILLLFLFSSTIAMANDLCRDSIERSDSSSILENCFQITESDLSFQEAILYEKLEHDFGTFEEPARLFTQFKIKSLDSSAEFMLAFARSIELAFDVSKPKWLGKKDGIISSSDDYTGYDEYSAKVKEMHSKWYLAAANAGSRDAQLQYINEYLGKLSSQFPVEKPSQEELDNVVAFLQTLADKGEPGAKKHLSDVEVLRGGIQQTNQAR
ncbi:hypothetical protein [Alteromonas sp. A079]|uniref:hypothetical protein n=1 Tax=Alteromonas sp. A079 TaxID=3410268 RepID=UPI003B9F5FD8